MSSRSWKVLSAVIALISSSAIRCETFDQGAAMLAGPWHHLPNSVSPLQFNRDSAQCKVIAAQTPIESTTPAVVTRIIQNVLINCLKANGYEPGAGPAAAERASGADLNKLAGLQYSYYSCSEVAKMRGSSPGVDAIFFVWVRGFVEGWNAAYAKDEVLKVDVTLIPLVEQMKIVRKYCDTNPTKIYFGAAMDLLVHLKNAAINAPER